MKILSYFILGCFGVFALAGIASSPVQTCEMQKGYGCPETFRSVVTGKPIDCSSQSGPECLGRGTVPLEGCNHETGENCRTDY